MDFLKDKLQGASGEKPAGEQTSAGGGGFMDKINGALGGGKSSEVNEGMYPLLCICLQAGG